MVRPVHRGRLLLVDVDPGPRFLNVTPPIGLLSLATSLRSSRPELDIEILDQILLRWDARKVARYAADRGVGLLGLSLMTKARGQAAEIARHVKRLSPETVVVVGGIHPTGSPEDALFDPAVDLALCGEAEKTFDVLIGRLRDGGSVSDIPGIVHRVRGETVVGPPPERIEDLDELPLPDWSMLDPTPYWRVNGVSMMGRRRYLPLMTARGCPFGCIYCHTVLGRRYRPRSPDRVMTELHQMRRLYGVSEFEFLDDIFNLQADRATEILERIRRELPGVRLLFPNGLRSDMLPPALVTAFRAAGTYYAALPVESGSPRIQRLIGKNLNLERAAEAIALCAEAGMFCNGCFMMGFPTETPDELRQTIDLALSLPLHQASFFRVTPYKGTALHESLPADLLQRLGDLPPEKVHHHIRTLNLSACDPRELKRANLEAMARFYLDPRRLVRIVRAHPRPLAAGADFGRQIAILASTR